MRLYQTHISRINHFSPFRLKLRTVQAEIRPCKLIREQLVSISLALCKTDSQRILVDVGNVSAQTISNEADTCISELELKCHGTKSFYSRAADFLVVCVYLCTAVENCKQKSQKNKQTQLNCVTGCIFSLENQTRHCMLHCEI